MNEAHFCGGTLIGEGDWVLTAAHCFEATGRYTGESRFNDTGQLIAIMPFL